MWLPPRGGRAIGFTLILTLAIEHAAERGCPARPLHRGRRLQVHQVVVGLAHARILALVTPPEEELGALLKEAACKWRKDRRHSFIHSTSRQRTT